MNSFGLLYRLTSFGESHGTAIGGVIDGIPAGIKIDMKQVQQELDRRRPGQSALTTARDEKDQLEILSGMQDGITLGTPIGFLVRNTNIQSKDYDVLNQTFRPGHADYTYQMKYGISASSGGGRASARETIARVVSGAFARQILLQWHDVQIASSIQEIDGETDKKAQEAAILKAKKSGDSVGGIIECRVKNIPAGLGSPIFDRLEADLAKAMLSIPATKGFEIGNGFAAARMKGSENNDAMKMKNGIPTFITNNAGGVLGGISTGEELVFRVAFKPTSTIQKAQKTVNTNGEDVVLENPGGRHDPCVVGRALPIVEAMCAQVLLDHALQAQGANNFPQK